MNAPSYHAEPLFEQGLKLSQYCPLCESNFNPAETNILGEKSDSHLLHIQCSNCRNAIIALVLISSVGVSSVGVVTDLGFQEVQRLKSERTVSTDDVIDAHHLLNDESAFFSSLVSV